MKDILNDIIRSTRNTIEEHKKMVPFDLIIESASEERKMLSMRNALSSSSSGIIAEFKRKSPSKGWINEKAISLDIAKAYQNDGASAISILTDTPFFGGSLKDLRSAREGITIPILRKDFIIDEYQLYQAKIIGADAVLLIAAALSLEECDKLAQKAHELGLEVLLEIHSEQEIAYINDNIDMVGINNRNLGTFVTDVENSFRLAQLLPSNVLLISESGISSTSTVNQLRDKGFKGFLIGENFMKTTLPGKALHDFINQLN